MTENSTKYGRDYCDILTFYYHLIQINVILSDVYTLSTISDFKIDIFLYKQHFNIYRSTDRLFSSNSQHCSAGDSSQSTNSKIITELQSSMTYILFVIVENKNVNPIINFSILVSGPNNVTFNHISKSK